MSKLIVLSDRDIVGYLSAHGIYPAEFYTDMELFREKSIFFDDSCVLFISFLSGRFSQKVSRELLKTLMSRAEDKEDKGIVKVLYLSIAPPNEFEDYYIFDGSLNNLREVRNGRGQGLTTISKLLDNCSYNIKNTEVYLSDIDYGVNLEALAKVRSASENKDPILDLVRIPKFEDL